MTGFENPLLDTIIRSSRRYHNNSSVFFETSAKLLTFKNSTPFIKNPHSDDSIDIKLRNCFNYYGE